jgi:SAM-dependent methyltransferase
VSIDRLVEHRRLWQQKPELATLYAVWFERLLEPIPEDTGVLEIGAGPGFLAEAARALRPDLRWTATDLLATPWNDVAADAGRLPLATGSVGAVVGIDVLHHLPKPADFFREAARVLGGTGELRLVEPWITPLGWLVYRFFHQEDCRLRVDPWHPFPEPDKDSFEPPRCRRLNAFAYLLSLGFREASFLPRAMVRPLLALDARTRLLSPLLGLRALLVWPSVTAAGTRDGAPMLDTGR